MLDNSQGPEGLQSSCCRPQGVYLTSFQADFSQTKPARPAWGTQGSCPREWEFMESAQVHNAAKTWLDTTKQVGISWDILGYPTTPQTIMLQDTRKLSQIDLKFCCASEESGHGYYEQAITRILLARVFA